ncbi:MAG: phosphatidylglycerol lysyltransferase domain-containing protein [Sedimentitalea sp.]
MSALSVQGVPRLARLLQKTTPFAIAALCLWLIHAQLINVDLTGLWSAVRATPSVNWVGALAATALSFWAVGRYDALAHRHMGTGFAPAAARRAGMAAIAFSQTLGLGLITGAFARWRLCPGLSPAQSVKLTLFVSVSFLGGLGVVISLVYLMFAPAPGLRIAGGVGVALSVGLTLVAVLAPRWRLDRLGRVGHLSVRLPTLSALAAIAGWTLIDTLAAGTVLYLLLPQSLELAWSIVVPAYLIALAAALMSGTPGGVGPFELVLLALLPQAEPAGLLAGIVAFRLIYFALPAVVAGLCLLRPAKLPLAPIFGVVKPPSALPFARPQAESSIISQGDGYLLCSGDVMLAMVDTAQASVAMFDPVAGNPHDAFVALRHQALRSTRLACFYKCGPRIALAARKAGWSVRRVARDALLEPAEFEAKGARFRQLRRKIRQSEKANIQVHNIASSAHGDDLAQIDALWQHHNGRAFGTTMGRYSAEYVAHQRIYLATRHGAPVAFITVHHGANEWCLDLMRARPDAADGTMHALVMAALNDAKKFGVARFSLAAISDERFGQDANAGLRQFKSAFAPRWEPRYMAAPSPIALMICGADLVLSVRNPDRVARVPPNLAHEHDEKNGFALNTGS